MNFILSEINQSIRNIYKNSRYWVINFLGFTISITIVLLTISYALFLYNTDKHHINVDRISIISMDNGEQQRWLGVPWYVSEKILPEIPEVEVSCRVFKYDDSQFLKVGNNEPLKTNLLMADSSAADIFTFDCLLGDVKGALKEPMSLVLTKSEAQKYFGNQNPIGKLIRYNSGFDLTVNAIIKDLPKNSLFSFNGLISSVSMEVFAAGNNYKSYGSYNYQTFALLNSIDNKEPTEKFIAAKMKEILEFESEPFVKLIPVKELFFSSNTRDYFNHGNEKNIFILLTIAFSILLLAIINFINLESVRFSQKVKGLLIRKVVGGTGFRIAFLILFESALLSFFATIIAVLISNLIVLFIDGGSIPSMFERSVLVQAPFLFIIVSFSVLIGVIAGIPSVLMAVSRNFQTLKEENFIGGKDGKLLQQSLVVFQFTVAVVLIIYTIGIFKQQYFILDNYDIGFEKNKILTVNVYDLPETKKEVLENRLMNLSNVDATAFCYETPGGISQHWGLEMQTRDEKTNILAFVLIGSENLPEVFDFEMKYGNVTRGEEKRNQIIINETAMKEFGISPDEIGSSAMLNIRNELRVIDGVCADFNFQSLHQVVKPMIITTYQRPFENLLIKFNSTTQTGISTMLGDIKNIVAELNPDKPFEYSFMDSRLAGLYKNETENLRMLSVASIAAIIIALLGLYGLSIFITNVKTKEIGIRKVNGARVIEILAMLNKDFVKWVAISFVIACPLAFYAMYKWLRNFAFKTELSWWIFALSGLLALGIALLTVSFQSWKAATRNPVEALRYE
ncbi:MAG: hypothetical protein JW833_03695 [Prolixibacteraceae bacterium]|nr:hypothetical protein [Prolixibacteraceae bacterium]